VVDELVETTPEAAQARASIRAEMTDDKAYVTRGQITKMTASPPHSPGRETPHTPAATSPTAPTSAHDGVSCSLHDDNTMGMMKKGKKRKRPAREPDVDALGLDPPGIGRAQPHLWR